MKSRQQRSDLVRRHASKPYNNIGIHLLDISWRVTSSGAIRSICPKNTVGNAIKRSFGLSKWIFECSRCYDIIPRYFVSDVCTLHYIFSICLRLPWITFIQHRFTTGVNFASKLIQTCLTKGLTALGGLIRKICSEDRGFAVCVKAIFHWHATQRNASSATILHTYIHTFISSKMK